MHFTQLHLANAYPDLKLYGACIPVVSEFKFPGLIFVKKLTFNKHVKYLKDRCMKALNLLRVVAHKDWGVDCVTLLKLYRSHVRSKLIMVVLCMVQLGNQSLSLLTVCRMRRCALVLEHSERLRLQAYMCKRENCPLNYDVNNCVYNISVNFDQIHATSLSIVYLVLASDACLRLDLIPSPHLVSD